MDDKIIPIGLVNASSWMPQEYLTLATGAQVAMKYAAISLWSSIEMALDSTGLPFL